MSNPSFGPMPTTRLGRFQLYKKRAQRRYRRANHLFATTRTIHEGVHSTHRTTRAWIYDGFPKQERRKYPRSVHFITVPNNSWKAYRVPPHFGVPPVLEAPDVRVLNGHFPTHPRRAFHLFFHRRVIGMPPLRYLERKPYLGGRPTEELGGLYPLPYYPSGQRGYRYWREHDE